MPEIGRIITKHNRKNARASTDLMTNAELMYLDLMKKTLTYSLWTEPGRPVAYYAYRLHPMFRYPFLGVIKGLRWLNLDLVARRHYEDEERIEGRLWPGQAHTMIGRHRLDSLQKCLESLLTAQVEGDLIETGVWRGGACIFMRAVLEVYRITDRRVFVADSFCGLPPPDLQRYPHDRESSFHEHNSILGVSRAEVEASFGRFGLLDDQVVFLEGWFQDTLPNAPIEKLALMRLDGDMYESTAQALESLYPKLSVGGFCIIDDYGIDACRRAVDDYRSQMGIEEPITTIDWTGVYWRKCG